MRRAIPILAAMALSGADTASANPRKSLYTTIELAHCDVVQKRADGGAWSCRGLDGYPVRVAEGDHRTFVSFGPEADKRRAARQTLKAFNTIMPDKARRATMEWRITRRDGKPIPHATILRYYTGTGPRQGQVLVVSKVSPSEACHVAYVDALATADAIVVARRIADTTARSFDCSQEPGMAGSKGQNPLLSPRP